MLIIFSDVFIMLVGVHINVLRYYVADITFNLQTKELSLGNIIYFSMGYTSTLLTVR